MINWLPNKYRCLSRKMDIKLSNSSHYLSEGERKGGSGGGGGGC